jgi:hypothetical protein
MTRCRLLSKAELDAARFDGNGKGWQTVYGLNIEPNAVMATNHHYLIRVPAVDLDSEQFPAVDGMKGTAPEAPVSISAKTALDTLKGLKKSTRPILQCAALTQTPEGLQLITTDLETPRVSLTKPLDRTFPAYEGVMPKDPPTLQTAFDAKYLKTICEYAIKHGGRLPSLKMDFTDALSAVKITIALEDGREALVVLMPVKR